MNEGHSNNTRSLDPRDYLLAALYAVGDRYITLDRETGEVTGSGAEHRPELHRASGAPVSTDPFVTPTHPHIAAVLASRSDAGNMPSRLGDDFFLLPNAFGAVLPLGVIPLGHEFRLHEEGENAWSMELISHWPTTDPTS